MPFTSKAFSTNFINILKDNSLHKSHGCRPSSGQVNYSIVKVHIELTLYHTIPSFNNPGRDARLDKEKMLVTSIFSLSQNVFYLHKDKTTFNLLSANTFNLVQSKVFLFGKGLKTHL